MVILIIIKKIIKTKKKKIKIIQTVLNQAKKENYIKTKVILI